MSATNAKCHDSGGRVWRFANCEFDERRRELRVRDAPVELESKPLEVLRQLLINASEVVTKEEWLAAVWPGVMVADGSLATAVSKLRKALGSNENAMLRCHASGIAWRARWKASCLQRRPSLR